ncbi:MAG: type II toxin-antitoxin system RelE/ParE family toxin [Fibrobacter sp.]|nr:type II toxin-antitoxin system RelE/ParE family toxin [Fibrobacter sp.]
MSDFPEAFALCQDEPWILREVRSMSVDNYRLFYHVDHDKRIIVILRVFYCRQETK